MKAVAVFPGRPDSIHLASLPAPSLDEIPSGRGVLVNGGERIVEVPADKINQGFVLGNKVMVGTVNANREYFELGVRDMAQAVAADPQGNPLTVDVRAQSVSLPDGRRWPFPLESEPKAMLVEGLDAIDLTLQSQQRIDAFLERDRRARPWIYLGAGR